MEFLESKKLYLIRNDEQYKISEQSNRIVRAVNQEHDLDNGVEVASGEINFGCLEFGLLL